MKATTFLFVDEHFVCLPGIRFLTFSYCKSYKRRHNSSLNCLSSGQKGEDKKPGFFGKLKTKLINLIVGRENAAQQTENGKARKKKTGLIIVLVLVAGGLTALIIALGNMNLH